MDTHYYVANGNTPMVQDYMARMEFKARTLLPLAIAYLQKEGFEGIRDRDISFVHGDLYIDTLAIPANKMNIFAKKLYPGREGQTYQILKRSCKLHKEWRKAAMKALHEWNAKKITISLHEFSLYNWLPLGVRNVNVYITNIESKDPEDNIMLWQDGREYTPFDCKTEYKEVDEIEFLELSLDMKKRLARRNDEC